MPTNPDCIVLRHIPKSGTPMQSAAKVPILVAFEVEQRRPAPLPPLQRSLACIFKVGDDVRQDVLALQVRNPRACWPLTCARKAMRSLCWAPAAGQHAPPRTMPAC